MTSDIDIPALARAALADVAIPSDRRTEEERSLTRAMQAYAAAPRRGDVHAALTSMGRVTALTMAMMYAAPAEAS